MHVHVNEGNEIYGEQHALNLNHQSTNDAYDMKNKKLPDWSSDREW